MTISLVPTTYERRCWVCPDTEANDVANVVASISQFHNVMVPITILLLT
jgi:hypothetical protein